MDETVSSRSRREVQLPNRAELLERGRDEVVIISG